MHRISKWTFRQGFNRKRILKELVKSCKETLQNTERDLLSAQAACSYRGRVRYSYDYAQQVHFRSNPQQPGQIYFKTSRKCGLLGICCEGLPTQINYLIDEAVTTGKGANATINYLHNFFFNPRCQRNVHIHADNCSRQSKNSYVIGYYYWWVLCGYHNSVLYSFLSVGHTKFSPDWCFGVVK